MIRLVIQLCDRLNLAQNLTDTYKAQVSSSAFISDNLQAKEKINLASCDKVLSRTSKMLAEMHGLSIHAAQSLLDQSAIQTSYQTCEMETTTGMTLVSDCEDEHGNGFASSFGNCGLCSVHEVDPRTFELIDEICERSKLLIDSLRAQVWSIPGICTSASLLRDRRRVHNSFNRVDDDGREDWFRFRSSSHQVFDQGLETLPEDSSVVR